MIRMTKSQMNRFDYKEWVAYFADNNEKRLEIDFSEEKDMPAGKKALIFPSIRAFRKGEGSEGRHLADAAAKWADRTGRPEYKEAMQWFVREENWHSAYLKKYMDFHRIKDAEKSFLDKIFRRLRQLAGLKCEVTVLVTAEMIALTYYDALSKCTESSALKSICRQMLKDEIPHIIFQSYTIGHFNNSLAYRLARILLMEFTSLAVWCAYRQVFEAGGYCFRRFLSVNLWYLRQSMDMAMRVGGSAAACRR